MIQLNSNIKVLVMSGIMLTAAGCSKDKDVQPAKDHNRVVQVLADNFNLSIMSTIVGRSNLGNDLNTPGPFTVFAPSDEAFAKSGYATTVSVLSSPLPLINSIGAYHTVEGNYDLNKMPFLFNQEITSRGGKLFITRWIKDKDTVLTINGSRLLATSIKASNGQVQVIDRMLQPYLYEKIGDAIAAESSLTLFWQAIQRAGLVELLNGKSPVTVYAPTNSAMISRGYATLEAINGAPVGEIAALVKYHIVADRRFVNDYILTTAAGKTSTAQGMLDNNAITVTLIPNPQQVGAFTGIRLRGPGNSADINLLKQDVIAGNGVLHIVESTLRITQ
ncbi:putative surface protein with fasciclin (FAS1) repeats [Chitinophaga dinghuensis]|uniref:Putative surface protein with fasciclin (FAS1) repeats n=1 Tax=Chitinophaga dinghuensis TaxID=1539050 RepID=A0A327VMR1_9BACT|nr:fasciclin domain-containing protein [Chitinophaga dinghuensis]RAJ76645.1 putative surface protein with fasciclin (FAS1) repeats [Chitinophaga dinghuensis]